ncbi:MAG: cache domain-containing protein [Quadrisphaera sp.]
MSTPPTTPSAAPETGELLHRTGERLGSAIDAAFDAVEAVRERTAEVLASSGRAASRSSLTALHPLFRSVLAPRPNPLEGVGVAVGPGVLADTDRWMEWWRRGPSGEPAFATHVLDPSALGYYDYQARPWFRAPIDSGRQVAVGPYLDAGGCDVYTTTLTVPLVVAPGAELVVGGDLDMAWLEAAFLEQVGRRRPAVALLAANDRVVVSNTALLTSGSRVPPQLKDAVEVEVPVPSRVPGRSSWRLVSLGQR